jgi:hypothetical protein
MMRWSYGMHVPIIAQSIRHRYIQLGLRAITRIVAVGPSEATGLHRVDIQATAQSRDVDLGVEFDFNNGIGVLSFDGLSKSLVLYILQACVGSVVRFYIPKCFPSYLDEQE